MSSQFGRVRPFNYQRVVGYLSEGTHVVQADSKALRHRRDFDADDWRHPGGCHRLRDPVIAPAQAVTGLDGCSVRMQSERVC